MWADYTCKTCGNVFEFKKEYGKDFPVNPECMACGSDYTTREYNSMTFTFDAGVAGNAKNGYTSLSNKRKSA